MDTNLVEFLSDKSASELIGIVIQLTLELQNCYAFISKLQQENSELKHRSDQNQAEKTDLQQQHEQDVQEKARLEEQHAQDQDENAKLKARVNQNSQNSSNPPSTDRPYNKPNHSLRKPSTKKSGGQVGHDGSNLHMFSEDQVNTIHHCDPERCKNCPHYEDCQAKAVIKAKRQVADFNIVKQIDEYRKREFECPLTNKTYTGEFPANVPGNIQYGPHFQALITTLNTAGAVSYGRIADIFCKGFGFPVSEGTIYNTIHRFTEMVKPAYEQIGEKLKKADVAHFDETGIKLHKKLYWAHSCSNGDYTYLTLSQFRGKKGMDEMGILPVFKGVAVTDCWGAYFRYKDLKHAICGAHIHRELNWVIENHPDQEGAKETLAVLLEMFKAKEQAIAAGRSELTPEEKESFENRLDKGIAKGIKENPPPAPVPGKKGRPKKGKALSLFERLQKYKDALCLFARDFKVPFTNNEAERTFRCAKSKLKVAGEFRSENGAKDYLIIRSYTDTARKHGYSTYEAIQKAYEGNPNFIFTRAEQK